MLKSNSTNHRALTSLQWESQLKKAVLRALSMSNSPAAYLQEITAKKEVSLFMTVYEHSFKGFFFPP